jgi:branched-chain amino acid transport system ATP-binding protein
LASNPSLLELRHVYSGYGEIEVLKDVSIHVEAGQIISVLGANGAGKSTLLKTIFGFVRPTQGQVMFDGDEISRESTLKILRRGISYVPEGRSNFPYMTVEENLEMGAYIRSDRASIAAQIDSLCERFPILKLKRHAETGSLSGGQQQMVEIAMALMLQPRVILIDEPTLGLAPVLVQEVFEIIKEINSKGTTVILVEQNARRALEISDYAFVLELGVVRLHGLATDLAQNEDVINAYLGER